MSSFSEYFSYKICTHKAINRIYFLRTLLESKRSKDVNLFNGHATGTNSLEVRKRTMYKVYMVRLRTSIF